MNTMAKFPLMVLSFILSIILWVYVQVQENPLPDLPGLYQLPLTVKNPPEGFQVVSQPSFITLVPQGSIIQRRLIDPSKLSVYVDLSQVKPSPSDRAIVRAYPIHISDGDYTGRWSLQSPDATVKIERVISRSVPVVVEPSGQLSNPASLYIQSGTYAEPAEVTIRGPISDVDSVVQANTICELSSAAPGGAYTGHIYPVLKGGVTAPTSIDCQPRTVVIYPDIVVSPLTRSLHVFPQITGQPAPGCQVTKVEVTPENLEVRGQSELITSLQFLSTPAVDIDGLKETKSFTEEPLLPPGIVLSPPSQTVSVKVTIAAPAQPPAKPAEKPHPKRRTRRRRA